MKVIEVYTDGACSGNPGPGSCAYAIVDNNVIGRHETFRFQESTNNIMEMTAVIKALEYCLRAHPKDQIYLYTDSQYVQKGMQERAARWKKNEWRGSAGKPIANVQLWEQILVLQSKLDVTCQWLRGHSGNPFNEFVDNLCK
jgi:ribonuclease HI